MSKAINRIASDTGNPSLSAELQDTIRSASREQHAGLAYGVDDGGLRTN